MEMIDQMRDLKTEKIVDSRYQFLTGSIGTSNQLLVGKL